MQKFRVYGYWGGDIYDRICPDYLFVCCIKADSWKKARQIAEQIAPASCKRFTIFFI